MEDHFMNNEQMENGYMDEEMEKRVVDEKREKGLWMKRC